MEVENMPSVPANDKEWPVGKRMAIFTCIVAALLNFFDMADRFMISVLLPYIQTEWGLSDMQLGGLVSIASFSVAVLVVPVAIIVDLWSRKKMIAIMGIAWSLATAAGAFVGSFPQLLVSRFCVGAGQAAYLPAAQSLLGDVFPKHWRTRAMGAIIVGAALGSPAGIMAAAVIAEHWGWRHAFGVLALPGLVIAIAAFFLNDHDPDKARRIANRKKAPSLLKALPKLLFTPTLLGMYVGNTLCLLYSGALAGWRPTYLIREAGFTPTIAGAISALGSIGIVVMIITTFVVDNMRKKDITATAKVLVLVGLVVSVGAIIGYGFMTPGSVLQIVLLLVTGCVFSCITPLCTTTILDVAPRSAKATAISLMVFTQNILGMACGPLVAGWLSDHVGLGPSLAILGVTPLIGSAAFFLSFVFYRRDMAAAESEAQAEASGTNEAAS